MPSETPIEVRQEWTRLRQIMYEPSAVWLSTENSGDRWLTDQYVLLNVTGSLSLFDADYWQRSVVPVETADDELPDGSYKLIASKGLEPRESIPQPDLEAWFGAVADQAQWKNAVPTEWSVAEHPGKAMLWTSRGFPALMGEPTWTQIKRHHQDVTVDYTFTHNLFRFSKPEHDHLLEDPCPLGGCKLIPFCFAAGIRTPDGQQDIAKAVAELVAA